MKVVGVETVVVGTPWRELTFVELVTDEGLRGVGEARMVSKTDTLLACIQELAGRHVVGMDPFDVERLAWRFHWEEYGRADEVTQTALAVIDVACHDLMGQATGQPVWRLLGGKFRDRVPAYANGWYQGGRDPRTYARLATEVVGRGYTGMKVDPFGAATVELSARQLAVATDIIAAVRDAVGRRGRPDGRSRRRLLRPPDTARPGGPARPRRGGPPPTDPRPLQPRQGGLGAPRRPAGAVTGGWLALP